MPVRKGRGSQSARVDMPADADSSVLPDLASMGEQCDWLRERLGLHPATVIELVLLDTEQMTRIHVAYLAEPGPTDVMAFPMDPPVAAGACLPPTERHPILRSYLDTVLAGFRAEYGPGAVADFVATTRGWEAPILDDRARPRYSRAIAPDPALGAEIDAALAALGGLHPGRRSPAP